MSTTAIERLQAAMIAAGLPVVGCAVIGTQAAQPGWTVLTRAVTGERVRLDFSSGPTAPQLAAAQSTLDAFSFAPRRDRTLAALGQDRGNQFQAASLNTQARVVGLLCAFAELQNATAHARLDALLGAVVTDEPDV